MASLCPGERVGVRAALGDGRPRPLLGLGAALSRYPAPALAESWLISSVQRTLDP